VWDSDLLRDMVRSYMVEGLGGNSGTEAPLFFGDTQVINKQAVWRPSTVAGHRLPA
jgi:hypothetical protein